MIDLKHTIHNEDNFKFTKHDKKQNCKFILIATSYLVS